MVKIIHAADFHLDSPFDNLTPEKAVIRRREQRDTLVRLKELANAEKADIVLLSGDLFDSENAFFETMEMLEQTFAQIEAKIFISPGNHDYYNPRSPYRSVKWPENVHIFRSSEPECIILEDLNCCIWGSAFTSRSCDWPMLRDFTVKDDNMINIMVMHGDTAAVTQGYNPVYTDDIAKSGLDYLALGHTHTFSGILRAGKTDYAYPGCIEGRGFDELGDKGVIVGKVNKGHTELNFRSMSLRRCGILEVDYEELISGKAQLPENTENDIYKVILTGLRDDESINRETAREKLKDKFWYIYLKDCTVMRRDIWALAQDDSLLGMFMREMRSLYDRAADDGQKQVIELAAEYGAAAVEHREVQL